MTDKTTPDPRQGHLESLLGRVEYWLQQGNNVSHERSYHEAVFAVGEYVIQQQKRVTIATDKPMSKKRGAR